MGVKFSNNAYGTLNGSLTVSDTSLTLASGQGARFPTLAAGDYFYATLIDTSNNLEIIKVTGRTSDVLTIVRAQENTLAKVFSIGDRVELRITAGGITDAVQEATLSSDPAPSLSADLDLNGNDITGTGNINLVGSYSINGTEIVTEEGIFIPKLASDPTLTSSDDGYMYYNTTDSVVKHWDGNKWLQMSNKFSASGGSESTVTVSGILYKVHVFTTSGTFTADSAGSVDVFLAAGGGGGGADNGAGGGAGGLVRAINASLNPGSYSIVIGAGGLGAIGDGNRAGNSGSNSTAFGYTAIGGGRAGSQSINGLSGGSGGGGSWDSTGGSGTSGQGYAGGTGGTQYGQQGPGSGGGGAGGAGISASGARRNGNGGPGFNIGTYVGTSFGDGGYLCGGGAGGCDNYEHEGFAVDSGYGLGGVGGGADIESTQSLRYRGKNGAANTGGGASGGAHNSGVAAGTRQYGGTGGSGICIIRYAV